MDCVAHPDCLPAQFELKQTQTLSNRFIYFYPPNGQNYPYTGHLVLANRMDVAKRVEHQIL